MENTNVIYRRLRSLDPLEIILPEVLETEILYIIPIKTDGGSFPPFSRFFANYFASSKVTHSKLGDFS